MGTRDWQLQRRQTCFQSSPQSPVPPFSLLGLDVDPRVVIPEDFLIGPSRARHPTRAPLAQTNAVTGPAAEELHDRLLVWGEPHDEERAAQKTGTQDRPQVRPFDQQDTVRPGDPHEADPAGPRSLRHLDSGDPADRPPGPAQAFLE